MLARRRHVRLSLMLAVALVMSLLASSVFAAPAQVSSAKVAKDDQGKSDDLKHPLGDKQRALHQRGLEKVFKGQAQPKGKNKVVEVAKG